MFAFDYCAEQRGSAGDYVAFPGGQLNGAEIF
jgi:hypothetical protein